MNSKTEKKNKEKLTTVTRPGDSFCQKSLLFILAREDLNNMVKNAKQIGWISGFEMDSRVNSSMEITHLQFADDTNFL